MRARILQTYYLRSYSQTNYGVLLRTFEIDFQPVGKRLKIAEDIHLLAAAQSAGVALSAVCGGVGTCADCKIRIIQGEVSEVQSVEDQTFSQTELSEGWRLACQVFPKSDLVIDIPSESLSAAQRLQIEGILRDVLLAPAVSVMDITIDPPGQDDLRADWERLRDLIEGDNIPEQDIPLPVLSQFSSKMREWGWTGRMILGEDRQPVGFIRTNQNHFGLAVDIGTTKVAAFLVDLTNGNAAARKGIMNLKLHTVRMWSAGLRMLRRDPPIMQHCSRAWQKA